jgi:ATP-dependent DNA ligase
MILEVSLSDQPMEAVPVEEPPKGDGFDLLADQSGRTLLDRRFGDRRAALEAAFKQIGRNISFVLSKATSSHATARGWLKRLGHGLDCIVAKRLELPYRPGERAMQKYKLWKTVGGVYYNSGAESVEYLLMGLYDEAGRLSYVGRCGIGKHKEEIGRRLRPLIGGPGFTANMPGGKSRWSGHERKPVALQPRFGSRGQHRPLREWPLPPRITADPMAR